MRGLKKAKECLLSGEYTCVLYKEDAMITSTRRGVSPLVKWLEAGDDFKGYYAADKVVGKATAFLYETRFVKGFFCKKERKGIFLAQDTF